MKKFLLISFVAIIGLSAFTFAVNSQKSANVEMEQGIYIFYKSKPVDGYDYKGTIKIGGIVKSTKASEMTTQLIKKVKKEYPDADGLIVNDPDFFAADVIKFK